MASVGSDANGKRKLLALVKCIKQDAVLHTLRARIRSGEIKTVASITRDNGSVFINSRRIDWVFAKLDKVVKVYYTYTYTAWEK